jgi:hypothetical protein
VAPVCHEYRAKGAVMPLVVEILHDVNTSCVSPESTLSLERIVENNYLLYTSDQKRPSAYRSYHNRWPVQAEICAPCSGVTSKVAHQTEVARGGDRVAWLRNMHHLMHPKSR